MNLAIFGGSFDPPHKGHKAIINALDKLDFIDKIIILPTFNNPLKNKPLFPTQKRIEWLQEIIKNTHKTIISTFETDQQKPNYTIDSVLHFKALYNPNTIYLVIGADILNNLDMWHNIDILKKEVIFIVATRNKIKIPQDMIKLEIDLDCNSSEIRTYLKNNNFMDSRIESCILDSIKYQIKNEVITLQTSTIQDRLDFIINLLDSKKAENITCIDLSATSYITQYVIIATSLADKHAIALLDTLKTELKPKGEVFYATDEESGDWIIADLGDIMIHIFTQNHRKKFNLEEFLNNYKS